MGATVQEGLRRAIKGMAEQNRLTEQGDGPAGAWWQLASAGQRMPEALGIESALGVRDLGGAVGPGRQKGPGSQVGQGIHRVLW